jgi:3-oxoacyl-[acyl-carrier-protein] synthase II
MDDIAVTGLGVISSLGIGRESFWLNCSKPKSGIKMISQFDTAPYRSNVAGMVDGFEPSRYMEPKFYRRLSRVSRMAVASSIEALEDSGLSLDDIDKERVAIIVGTSYGGSSHIEDFYVSLLKNGPRGAQPFLFPETVPNAPASHIAMLHGITGPNTTFCQNEISAEHAILYAMDLLRSNQVDVALACGAEELSQMQYACYDDLRVLNEIRIKEKEEVVARLGGGMILGEGAGVLVMERLDSALRRHAKIYGKINGGVAVGGIAPYWRYETGGEQMRRAILLALEICDISPEDIDHISVSANFSGELDRIEYQQLMKIFEKISHIPVTPLKYLMGSFGGAGVIRMSAVLLSLYFQSPLPSVNVNALVNRSASKLDWKHPKSDKLEAALMTSSTFGGGSVSFILTRYTGFKTS